MFKLLNSLNDALMKAYILIPMNVLGKSVTCTSFFDGLGLGNFLHNIENFLLTIGIAVFVIGVVIGGLMRAAAFGSERRVAASNVAISCAVVGFIIVLIAVPLGNVLNNQAFTGATCQ